MCKINESQSVSQHGNAGLSWKNATNSVTALNDNGQSTRSTANPTRLSSLKRKAKNVTNVNVYIDGWRYVHFLTKLRF